MRWPLLFLLALAAGAGEATTPAQLAFATTDDKEFDKLGKPRPGDWLARIKERGQSYERYVRQRPVRAGEGDVLGFMPVGPFAAHQRAVFDKTVAFAGIWYDLPTKTVDGKPLPVKNWHRERDFGRQYHTEYFLKHLLPHHMPKNAVCLFGVTMADLYPEPSWNYVFGMASLRGRVGVWSFARYEPEFWGKKRTEETDVQLLRRACRVVVHEVGHAFTMEHCTAYLCTMNGSMSLAESDRQPLRLCPVCLKKLQWNRGFDVVARYKKLRAFYKTNGLAKEAKWIDARLARVLVAQPLDEVVVVPDE